MEMIGAVEKARVQLKITGRVQGVYFRASTQQQARMLGVTGWVTNCPDGSVEAVVEGPKSKLEEMIAWCRQGPDRAQVSEVGVRWEPAQNAFRDFSIKR